MLVEGVCLLAVLLVYFIIDEMFMKRRLPPGPMPLPIIGNLHLLSDKPYLDFYQLALRYGPVCRFQMGSNLIVVINGYTHAREALVHKGSVFAGRPSTFAGKLFSRESKGVGFQGYTKQLKQQRKAIIQTMRSSEKDGRMETLVQHGVDEVISNIEGYFRDAGITTTMSPKALRDNVTMAKNHIMASVAFGENLNKNGKNEISHITDFVGVFSESLAVTSIIDAFPFVTYFPLDIINRFKEAIHVRDKIFDERFEAHKKLFDNNCSEVHNLADMLIQMQENPRGNLAHNPANMLTNDHVIMAINDAIIAGSESPSSTFISIIYFLVKFPDMQKRIQKEVDDVIGRNNVLNWSDRERLPFLEAFIHECMRCGAVMPLTLPHETTADTCIGSFTIPKNTTVFVNVYAIHRDPETWQNPLEFQPERFLDKDGSLSSQVTSKLVVFGLGHRMCPGEILARMEMFLFTANLLQKYTFSYKGQLPVQEEGKFGLVLRTPDIEVTISKRQQNDYLCS